MIPDPHIVGNWKDDSTSMWVADMPGATPLGRPQPMRSRTQKRPQITLRDLFLAPSNIQMLQPKIRPDVRLLDTMNAFAEELKLGSGEMDSINGDITESVAYVNQLYLDRYGFEKKDRMIRTFNSKGGRYPKAILDSAVNYNDVYSFRAMDAQQDQQTFRHNSNFRYGNQIPRWQTYGIHTRHATENDGLRLGSFQEAENINRGYAMETVMATNQYNTKPTYFYDAMLANTDRLQ